MAAGKSVTVYWRGN